MMEDTRNQFAAFMLVAALLCNSVLAQEGVPERLAGMLVISPSAGPEDDCKD